MSETIRTLKQRFERYAPDPELHGSFYPYDVYPGEAISLRLWDVEPEREWDSRCRVWRISPLGIEILVPGEARFTGPQRVKLELSIGDQRAILSGVTTAMQPNQPQGLVLGIRLVDSDPAEYRGEDRRNTSRWICSEQFFPTCVAPNPARFNDFVYFRAKDLSGDGMRLHTSLRNKFLVKGMTLDCTVSFPMVSHVRIPVEVKNVQLVTEGGKDFLAVGVSMGQLSARVKQTVGQYLVQFGEGVSLDTLRAQGLIPKAIGQAVEFTFVRTLDEYEQVLQLRHVAYSKAGKVPETFGPQDMGELYDARSRIVIGKYKGRVVASAGLVFNEYHDRMELEESLDWPSHLPRREQMVEVIRNCTHPEFRGSDLLMALFRFVAITTLQAGRQYVVIGCTPDLVRLYARIGMELVDLDYRHHKLNGSPHKVMIGDIPKALTGGTTDPVYWNAIWAECAEYLGDSHLLPASPLGRTRMSLYRLFSPVAVVLQYWMKRPRKAKR